MLDIKLIQQLGQGQLTQEILDLSKNNLQGFLAGLSVTHYVVQNNVRTFNSKNENFNSNLADIFCFLNKNPMLKNYILANIKTIARKALLANQNPDSINIGDPQFIQNCSTLGITFEELGRHKLELINKRNEEIRRIQLEKERQERAKILEEEKRVAEVKRRNEFNIWCEVNTAFADVREHYEKQGLNFDKLVFHVFSGTEEKIKETVTAEQAKLNALIKSSRTKGGDGKYKIIVSNTIMLPGNVMTDREGRVIVKIDTVNGLYRGNNLSDDYVKYIAQKESFERAKKINMIVNILKTSPELSHIVQKLDDDTFCEKLAAVALSSDGKNPEDIKKEMKDAFMESMNMRKSKSGPSLITYPSL